MFTESQTKHGFLDKAKLRVEDLAERTKEKLEGFGNKLHHHHSTTSVSSNSTAAEPFFSDETTVVAEENPALFKQTTADLLHLDSPTQVDMHSTKFLNKQNVRREFFEETPVVKTVVFQEAPVLVKEIIHEVPLIEKEIHEREVINKDIIIERPIIEREFHEVPIFTTETVLHDVEVRGNLPLERDLQRQVVQENAIVTETFVKDQAVLGKVVEHDKPLIHKEIHMQPFIEKEIIHERPIIEREVKEVNLYEKELQRDATLVNNFLPAERQAQKLFVQEQAIRDTEVIHETPVLKAEFIHEKPLIEKQIYERPVITKEIVHEMPLLEKHLIEKQVGQTEVIREGTQVEQVTFVEEAIRQSLGTVKANETAYKLVWLDNDRFMIENQGIFTRFLEKSHGPLEKLNPETIYFKKDGLLERFSAKLHKLHLLPREHIYIRMNS